MISVYHMLECHAMDILAFPPYSSEFRSDDADTDPDEERRSILYTDESGWCLFSIDVRNTYGTPFEVSIERTQKGNKFIPS